MSQDGWIPANALASGEPYSQNLAVAPEAPQIRVLGKNVRFGGPNVALARDRFVCPRGSERPLDPLLAHEPSHTNI